ncbi:hypothetical protein QBC39DRAFT_371361 [Podospora conica]|nr:hypothetical protein QBC39DRAFT_371361 [Schizothecium conicum]
MDPKKMESDGALDGLIETDFPHLFSFANQARIKGSAASRCRAKIDLFQFNAGGHQWFPDLSTEDLFGSHPRLTQDSGPALLIIEDVDLESIHSLRTYFGWNNTSFPRFLDSFLFSLPSFTLGEDIALHLPALESTKRKRDHLGFHYHHVREYQWNQKVNLEGIWTQFRPILLCRHHYAAWFDVGMDGQWKTGVILVEPNLNITSPASLSRPLYTNLLDRSVIQDPKQERPYRTVLSMLTKHALDREDPRLHPPPAFRLLEGIYRILTAEWMVLHTYYLRDINSIEWRLHRGRADTFRSTHEFEGVLDMLFRLRTRLAWSRGMVDEQRTTCAARGSSLSTPWDGPRPSAAAATSGAGVGSGTADDLWTDLVADYDQVYELLRSDADRVQEDINYIAYLLTIQQTGAGVKEAERGVEQNRMVLVLAIVATFLLPIGTVSTVLGMEGDWAPGGSQFGMFWVIVLPASVVLMGSMLAFMFWGRQNRQATTVPVKMSAAPQALAGQDSLGGHGTGRDMSGLDLTWVSRRRFIHAGGKVMSGEGV